MVAVGYGTELTVESIWATTWDTTQFGHINALIGTKFNFWINDAPATDITSVLIVSMLAAETNELFAYWNAIIKSSSVTNPWDFIRIWINEHFIGDRFLEYYEKTIEKCKKLLNKNKTIEIVRRTL